MEIFIAFLVVLGPIVPFSEGVDTCFVDTPKAFYIKDIFYGDIFKATVLDKTELKGFNITKNTAGLNDKDLLSYFNLNMKDNVLIMSTADPYKNFAKLAYSDSDVAIISTTIFLTCSGESNDEFMSIIIADSFSHLPVFDQNSYEYGVAMPIMPTLDITYYGTKIQVSEDNFSNKDITFSIDPDDFTIDSVKISDKIFNASFSANKVLQFSENQTYILTATNSIGNSSSVPLIIYADEDSGLDSPLFQKAHYSFEYSDGDLKPKDGVIKVNSIKLNESNYNIEGDNKENFKLTFNNNTGEFPLELMDSFPSTLKGRMVLDLKFTTDATTSTVLLINIAEVVPTFSNGYYDGIYNPDSNAIEWDVIPNVSKAVSLTVDENVKTLFTVNQTDYTITPTSKLTAENFDGNGNIIFTLKAHSSTANEAEAVVVVSLQSDAETELQFADPYYEGSYGTNSKVTLNSQFTFKDLTDLTGIEISVDAPYNDNFDIELKDDKWTVKVIKKLSKDVLNDNTHLLVPITGTKSGLDGSAKAVLMLDLPEKVVIQFSELYYTGTYLQDDEKDSVHLDKAIKITGIDGEDAVFAVEGYENYLNLSCSSDTCKIDVIQKFDDSILTNANYLTMTIKATYEDLTNQAVLVLDLPVTNKSDAQIEFKNIHYSAQYNIDSKTGKGSVDLNDGPIEFENSDNLSVDFQFEADYKNNFDLTCTVETSTCEISVKKELENSTLAKSGPLIITITATASQEKLTSQMVLVLDLPSNEDTDAQIEFKNVHYSAQYNVDSKTGKDSVDLNDGPIEFDNSDNLSVDFEFEADFKNNFNLSCNAKTSKCAISVINNLESSILAKKRQLAITIKAAASAGKLTSQTVLILDLPTTDDPNAELTFEYLHYAAQYILDPKTGKAWVNLTENPIKLNVVGDLDVDYEFEGFKDNFNLSCIESICNVVITKELENATLASFSQLVLTVTAAASAGQITSRTVLILELPVSEVDDAQIEFEKTHYAAQYVLESGKYVVNLTEGDIKLNNKDNLIVDVDFEDYDNNFKLKFNEDSSSYYIEVITELSDINSTQLILTATATAKNGELTAHTVIILDLPITENILSFKKSYYSAFYISNSLKLIDTIIVQSEDFSNLQFSFEDYDDNFKVEPLSKQGQYNVTMKDQLNQSLLEQAAEIYVVLVVTDSKSKLEASTVLTIKLPLYWNHVFEDDHYDAEYLKDESSDSDKVNVNRKIKIVDPEFSQLSVLGYEENFVISCNSTTLECSLSLVKNLNSSSLSSEELFLTLVASTMDQFSTGRSILLLKLPLRNSTFEFEKQLYQANYNIQSSEDELATISLVDVISLKGAYVTDVSIVCDDEYSHYFKFELTATGWELQLQKNIEAEVLSGQSQLITSLTASNSELTSFAKAAFIVNFPNETSVAFDKLQYFGDYIGGDSPSVTMEDEIVVSNSENCQIVLESFSEIFEVIQKKTNWLIKPKSKLNSTILSQYSEIYTEMRITKIGVPYGKAVLTIRLPEFNFSKKKYSGSYIVDDENVPKIEVEKIQVTDIDEDYIEVSLSDYSDYFKITSKSGVCTVSVIKLLPSKITNKYGTLVSTLTVSRKLDSRTLATSTLIITLPDTESTESPRFSDFSYYGDYKNSDTPTVELQQFIELAYDNEVVIESVKIDDSSSHYASNFEVKKKDYNTYIVDVVKPLTQEIFDELSTVVLTLVANSTQNEKDYAALVIALPKTVRNASVQVENQEILFNGTYDDGKFSSPQINLEFANNTKDSDVRVIISNDLGIDNKHFHYSYSSSKKLLTIQIDPFSDDLVSDISVIPLKLAITDINTQDTIFAVLNVKIADTNSAMPSNVGLIVAVSILAGLLLLLVVAAFVYWFYKIRKVKYSEMINQEAEAPNKTSLFTKNETKKLHGSFSSASLRRPTGLGIGMVDAIPEDTSTDGVDGTPESSPEVERKVAFDDNVKKIEVDKESSGFKSVANRRPTEFVFGYPLESGVLDNTTYDRRESSDYNVDIAQERRTSLDLPEKKSVAFDENIERMHIDSVEADDSNHEDEEEEDQGPKQHKTEAELYTADEEQLPSQIFKEIF